MSKDSEGFDFFISYPWVAFAVVLPVLQLAGAINCPFWLVSAPLWIQACRFFALLGAYIWRNWELLK